MILELDAGNTRLKWRVLDGVDVVARGAVLHDDNWREQIVTVLSKAPERIRVANVAGSEVREHILQWGLQTWGVRAEFASTAFGVGVIKHIYASPRRLGVDRWLAMLAARQLNSGVSIVVDAGSAVTVDVLSERGEHLGGYIVPGLAMQGRALFSATDDVRVPEVVDGGSIALGVDTSSAVVNGGLMMIVAMIARVAELYPDGRLFLCGGDGRQLLPFLPPATVFNEDLVMDGLQVQLP